LRRANFGCRTGVTRCVFCASRERLPAFIPVSAAPDRFARPEIIFRDVLLHVGDVDRWSRRRCRERFSLGCNFGAISSLICKRGLAGHGDLLELHNIGKLAAAWEATSGALGFDKRLPRMRGTHRIGKNTLPGMKCVEPPAAEALQSFVRAIWV